MNIEGPPSDSVDPGRFCDRLAQAWRKFKLPAFVLLTGVTVVLGGTGFAAYARATGANWSSLEILYRTLLLFTASGGEVNDSAKMNTALEVARFLAPALTAYAAFLAVVNLFSEQWARLKVRLRFRDHVVICGLGGIGYRLACRCRAAGLQVVVIEQDTDNDRIAPCRSRGIIVLTGDARDPLTLGRAMIVRARHVVIVCGDDGANIEAGMAVRRAVSGGPDEAISCVIHLLDTRTCELLAERELRHPGGERVRLHFFNVYQRAAQALLRERPLFDPDPAHVLPVEPPNLLIVGLGRMGQSFVGEAARLWHRRHGGPPPCKLSITVLDTAATERLDALRARQPSLDQLCDFAPLDLDITSAGGERGEFLRATPDDPGRPLFTHLYVFFADDARNVSAALLIQRQLRSRFGARGEGFRIVVRTRYLSGLGELLLEEHGALALLHPFGFLESVCDPGLLPGNTSEMLARALHRDFLFSEAAARRHDPHHSRKPTDRPWEQLDEDTRQSNRARADAVEKLLDELDLGLRPRLNWSAPYFEFTNEEVEHLAQREHTRWCEERERHGWCHAPTRDDAHKRHSDLVDWPQLCDSSKEFNRYSCRRIPLLLADFDFEVFRRSAGSA